jgi:hypothetical protein
LPQVQNNGIHQLLSQVDTFLLRKHKNLGELLRLKIGHDNKGAGPGMTSVSTFACFASLQPRALLNYM